MSDKTINNLVCKEKNFFLCRFCRQVNVCGSTDYSTNKDVKSLLTTVLSNQKSIMGSLTNLETRMSILEKYNQDIFIQRSEILAQKGVMRECKVLIKRMHKSMCHITEETDDGIAIEIMSTLPISSIDACLEVEEKLKNFDYEASMKTLISKLKGSLGTLDNVLKSLFADELSFQYNIDGKFGKMSFMKMTLINKTLFDVFQKEGLQQYNKGVRKYLDLSHNRYRQKQHHESKKPKLEVNAF